MYALFILTISQKCVRSNSWMMYMMLFLFFMLASIKHSEKIFITGSAKKQIFRLTKYHFVQTGHSTLLAQMFDEPCCVFWSNNIAAEQRNQTHWYVCECQYACWVFVSISRKLLNCKALPCVSVVVYDRQQFENK